MLTNVQISHQQLQRFMFNFMKTIGTSIIDTYHVSALKFEDLNVRKCVSLEIKHFGGQVLSLLQTTLELQSLPPAMKKELDLVLADILKSTIALTPVYLKIFPNKSETVTEPMTKLMISVLKSEPTVDQEEALVELIQTFVEQIELKVMASIE